MRALPLLLFVIWVSLAFTSCSVPNLEDPQCTDARDAAKAFYSFHFGNDMTPSAENLSAREKYLTPELKGRMNDGTFGSRDYFTDSEQFPKAFRIGTCELSSAGSANLQVVLFWRNEMESRQEEVHVRMILKDGSWLIDNVSK